MDLIKVSLAYTNKQPLFALLILVTFINNVLFGIIMAELMIVISKGSTGWIPYLVVLKLLIPLLSYFEGVVNRKIAAAVERRFNQDEFDRYNRLSHMSKNKLSPTKFNDNLAKAKMSIVTVIDWGMSTSCSLTGTFISCLWTFVHMGLFREMIIITVLILLIYFLVIKDKQKQFSDNRHKKNDTNKNIRAKITLLLPSFQYKERTPDDMNAMFSQIQDNNNKTYELWHTIMLYMNMLNEFGILIVVYCVDVAKFMLISSTLSNLSNAVKQLTHFLNHFNEMVSDYKLYIDLWKDLEFQGEPVKLDIPSKLTITGAVIKKGDFVVSLNPQNSSLSFDLGSKVLIKGKTGGGKTTFLEGLTGKLPGLTLSYGKPENFYHTIADMYQDIRENIPSAGVSIRDWFKEEKDNSLITSCLSFCFEKSELARLMKSLEKEEEKSDQLPQKHAFDADIQKKLSGGQKSRLCLATRIYEMKKHNKQMLILDESEQGSDPGVAVHVLQGVFKEFHDKTIVMISHMCDCQLNKLDVSWTHRLVVKDQMVTKI